MDIEEILYYAKQKDYHDLHIFDNSVLGFYKTNTVKYKNQEGILESYLFPTTFTFENNSVVTTMLLGFADKNFTIPKNRNIENGIRNGVVVKTIDINNHLYQHLIVQQTDEIPEGKIDSRFMHTKVLGFIIFGLSQVNFPFIQIANSDSLQEKPNFAYLEFLKEKHMNVGVEKYIEKNYNYIVIFTNFDNANDIISKKRNLHLAENGYTCCWVIAQSRKIDKIILYIRENGENKIYKADYIDRENIEGRRYKVYFKNLKFIEYTVSNWKEFTNTQSPIRYINK